MENTAVTEYSIQIMDVNVHDEGPYACSVLTNKKPKSSKVHLIVQGKIALCRFAFGRCPIRLSGLELLYLWLVK